MMPVEAVLITGPAIDFNSLLSLTHEALGYSIAENADTCGRKLVDTEKYLSCLAALKGSEITPHLFVHVSFAVLVLAEERDLLDILEYANMPFVRADTLAPGVKLALLTGNLVQWRDAVASATSETVPPTVRTCYSKILHLFDRVGLSSVWSEFNRTPAPDRSGYLLEYHA